MNIVPRHFRTQLLLAFLVVVAVPLTLVFTMVYSRSATVVREEIERSAASALEQGVSFVEYQMRYLHRLSELVSLDRNLREILSLQPGEVDLSGQLDQYRNLSGYLSLLQSRDGAYRIRLYIDDRWFYARERFNMYGLAEFADVPLGSSAFEGRRTLTLPERTYRYSFEDIQDVLTVVRPINATNNLEEVVAVVCVDTLSTNIRSVLSDMLQPYGGSARLIDEAGVALLEIDGMESDGPAASAYSATSALSALPWTLDVSTPYRRVFASLFTFRRFVLITVTAVIGAFAALSMLLSFILSRRVTSVVESIRAVQSGALTTRAEVVANDEIGLIEAEFNSMVTTIGDLVSQVEQDGVALREAELKALQSQINPHFLYNTLDLISWKALDHSATDIHELVVTMAKFYKSSLAGGKGIVTLADECEHIRLYTKIENMRFENSISIDFHVEESLADCELPKITLQPLVENAIHHGILESGSKTGHVWIRADQADEFLLVDVIDDGRSFLTGPGWFGPKELGSFSRGFGVQNIHARLQTLYGSGSGLSFRLRDEGGTIVRITVPHRKRSV